VDTILQTMLKALKHFKFFICLGVGFPLHALNKFRNEMMYIFSDWSWLYMLSRWFYTCCPDEHRICLLDTNPGIIAWLHDEQTHCPISSTQSHVNRVKHTAEQAISFTLRWLMKPFCYGILNLKFKTNILYVLIVVMVKLCIWTSGWKYFPRICKEELGNSTGIRVYSLLTEIQTSNLPNTNTVYDYISVFQLIALN